MSGQIEHEGIIHRVDGDMLEVLIVQQSACEDCHAKSVCSVSDKKEKIVNVEKPNLGYAVGDHVIVFGNQKIGFEAVLLAFIVPFVLVLFTLIIAGFLISNELISGVLALLVLVPYYLIISFFNKKLKTRFRFDVRKNVV